jgi:hypothetical protein
MQLKNIRMKDVHNAIEDRLDFGVRASKRARELLDIEHSMRGYAPLPVLGYHGPAGLREALPTDYYLAMCDQMERLHVSYVIESYNTVIMWVDGTGHVHIPPFRHSRTTTEHQHTARYALQGQHMHFGTERSELSHSGTIGRDWT